MEVFTQHQLDYIADRLYDRMQGKAEPDESELMPFGEIRSKRKISVNTLTRWIEAKRLKTFRYGRGKAIRRTDYSKLP